MSILASLFNKFWPYIATFFAAIASVGIVFLKGQQSGKNAEKTKNLEQRNDEQQKIILKQKDINNAANKGPKTDKELIQKLEDGKF